MLISITTSIAYYDPIYKESGQIQLDKLDLEINKNSIGITNESTNNFKEIKKLRTLCENPQIKESLIKDINNNVVPQAIGYTTYNLKEVQDSDGKIHYEPMTVSEVNATNSADSTTKYNLTITLNVNTYTGGSTRYLGVHTHIYWAPAVDLAGERRVANGSDDFCSLSIPTVYKININSNGGIEGFCTNPYLKDVSDHAAVAGFRENNGGTYMRASSTRSASGSVAKRRFVTKYVHTWEDAVPSISISSSGDVTFGLTSSKEMWQIAAYVDYTC